METRASTPGRHPGGRPTKYNARIAAQVCHRLSTSPVNLEAICRGAGTHPDTFYEWKSRHPEFSEAATRAMDEHFRIIGERLIDFSDRDVIQGDRSDSARVQLHRVRIETRRWVLSKRVPDVYGDRLEVSASVEFARPNIFPPLAASDAETEPKALPAEPQNPAALPPRGSRRT